MSDHTINGAQQIARALDLLQQHATTPIPVRLSCRLGDAIVWRNVLDLIAEECRIDDDVIASAYYLLSRHHLHNVKRVPLTGMVEVMG